MKHGITMSLSKVSLSGGRVNKTYRVAAGGSVLAERDGDRIWIAYNRQHDIYSYRATSLTKLESGKPLYI